jgi:hypothetical protein
MEVERNKKCFAGIQKKCLRFRSNTRDVKYFGEIVVLFRELRRRSIIFPSTKCSHKSSYAKYPRVPC